MKRENQEKIFKILEPVVEFLQKHNVDCRATIFRSNYGAIRIKNYSDEIDIELREFIEDKDCSIFTYDELLGGEYIIFSFMIDGKWSHAWE